MPGHRRRDRRLRVRGPLCRQGEGDADNLAAIIGSVCQALWGVPGAIREQSPDVAARCYPGMERTVSEFEAKFGGY